MCIYFDYCLAQTNFLSTMLSCFYSLNSESIHVSLNFHGSDLYSLHCFFFPPGEGKVGHSHSFCVEKFNKWK